MLVRGEVFSADDDKLIFSNKGDSGTVKRFRLLRLDELHPRILNECKDVNMNH